MVGRVLSPWAWESWEVAPSPTLPPVVEPQGPRPVRVLVTEEERTSPLIPEAARVQLREAARGL